MIIQNLSASNELFVNGALNPSFFGVTSTPSASKTVPVTPPPITQRVTVTPPSVVQDGVTVNFPPYSQDVTLQPPPVQITIPSVGGDLRNTFESVGLINPGGQFRLCALVRPNVIAAARHYNNAPYTPYIGMTVAFISGETAKITGVVLTRDDFECYRLDKNITGVQPASIAPLEPNFYSGREIIMFGLADQKRPVAGKTTLKYAFGTSSSWVGTTSNKASAPIMVQPGDSGSPVFIVANGVVQYFGSLGSVNLSETKINLACPHAAEIGAL
jgi:hypothetical protein